MGPQPAQLLIFWTKTHPRLYFSAMTEPEPLPSYFDMLVEWRQEQLALLRKKPRAGETKEQLAAIQTELFQELAKVLAKREKDLLKQEHIIQRHYNDPLYNANLWRNVAWIDGEKLQESVALLPGLTADQSAEALPMVHRQLGAFTVRREEISFDDDRASRNLELLSISMKHVKAAWGGKAIDLHGTQEFKTISWALAEVHGVKVANFAPEGAATMTPDARAALARTIIGAHDQGPQAPVKNPFRMAFHDLPAAA